MVNFWVAIGLVLVIEGLIWALIPRKMFDWLKKLETLGEQAFRQMGVGALVLGVLIVYLALA